MAELSVKRDNIGSPRRLSPSVQVRAWSAYCADRRTVVYSGADWVQRAVFPGASWSTKASFL